MGYAPGGRASSRSRELLLVTLLAAAIGCGSDADTSGGATGGDGAGMPAAGAQAGAAAQAGGAITAGVSGVPAGGAMAAGASGVPSGGATPMGGSGAQSGAGTSGSEAGAAAGADPLGGSAAPSGNCPATMPTADTPCDGEVSCSYGAHPLLECRTHADCYDAGSGLQWIVSEPACDSDARCPAPIDPDTCAFDVDRQIRCYYPDGNSCLGCSACSDFCPPGSACVPCNGQPEGTRVWECTPPPRTQQGCPSLIPNEGAACALDEDTVCYSIPCSCAGGASLSVVCSGGTWQWQYENCPVTGCPVCAAPDTPIATPDGERPIAELREGDVVLSLDAGVVAAVPIVRTIRRPVHDHAVVRVVLSGGAALEVSAPHPTADGRTLGSLSPGDRLGEAVVESVSMVPYEHAFTYDILPASDTGSYFAAGVLLGSTLR